VIPNISTTQRYTSGSDQGKSWLVWGWRASTSILLLLLLVILLLLLVVILTRSTSATKEDQCQEAQETTTESQEKGCQGWMLIHRRGQYGNPPDFFSSKLWDDYVQGFGEPTKEFWLGLETMANLTSSGTWELLVELEDFKNKSYVAMYHRFSVESSPMYRLSISGYDTDASSLADSLTQRHNSQSFSTSDRDNDISGSNCADLYLGAWWYDNCHVSNLNGYNYNRGDLPHEKPKYYAKGIIWMNNGNVEEQDYYFSWPKAEMKIRRKGC